MGKRIKASEVYENRFYRIPKAFFNTDKYKGLSLYAKVIYGFLDDRRELSLKNNWIDSDGNIYMIFTRKKIQEMLCLSDKPVTNAFKELNNYGLIEETRQGINKPNLIYVCHINYENIEDMRIRNISESRTVKNTNQESEEIRSSDTNLNKTNLNETEKIYIDFPINENSFFNIYGFYYEKEFNKKHMRINRENYIELDSWIQELISNGIDKEIWTEQVSEHFINLPSKNNGNIVAFMKSSFRYFETHSPKQLEAYN